MKILKLLSLVCALALVSCDSLNPFAAKQEKMKNLEGKWYLQGYEVEGVEAELTELERTNYMELKSGKRFECLEKGAKVEGNWDYYGFSETISLMEDGNIDCLDLDVIEATEDQLIYDMETQDRQNMRVWMSTTPTAQDPDSQN